MECAWAGSRKKNTYLNAKFKSLIGRRGKKRALVAVGHKILIMSYYVLKDRVPYKELGFNYLDSRKKDRIVRSHVKRLESLGYSVAITAA